MDKMGLSCQVQEQWIQGMLTTQSIQQFQNFCVWWAHLQVSLEK